MDNSECDVPDNTNVNMKYQIDFMKAEYNQMFNSWFNLKKEKADYIKTYIALVMLPPTIIVAVMKISSPDPNTPFNFLDFLDPIKPIFLIISFLGFLITAILINTRLESIMYIRNINSIRKAFCELSNENKNNKFKLSEILKLPTKSSEPNFKEFFGKESSLLSVLHQDIIFTAFINTIYFSVSALKIFYELFNIKIIINLFFIFNILVSAIFLFLHIIYYLQASSMKEYNWDNRSEGWEKPSWKKLWVLRKQ